MNIVPVKKTCEIVNGFAFESEHFNTQRKGLPVVRIRDVVRGFSKTFYSGDYNEAYEVNHGDLLIGMDGEFNIAEWRGGLALLNQRVCKIVAKPGIADSSFLKYRLGLLIKEIEDRTPFVTVKHLSSDDLKTSEIELPHIDEQKRIAAILDKADRLRRQRRFAQTLSDSFLQSVFNKMFGDPVANPKQWNQSNLGDLCEIRRGASPRPIDDFMGGTVPWIKIGDGTKGDDLFITSTKSFVTVDGAKKSVELKKGALIFANCGVSLGFARILKIDGCIHDGWLAFENVSARILDLFLLKSLNQMTLHLRGLAPEGTQPNLNSEIMRRIPIIIPPLPVQEKFAAIVQKFERIRRQQREATRQAEHLFQTLLHRAFRGDL